MNFQILSRNIKIVKRLSQIFNSIHREVKNFASQIAWLISREQSFESLSKNGGRLRRDITLRRGCKNSHSREREREREIEFRNREPVTLIPQSRSTRFASRAGNSSMTARRRFISSRIINDLVAFEYFFEWLVTLEWGNLSRIAIRNVPWMHVWL